jgi:hypothetical protein
MGREHCHVEALPAENISAKKLLLFPERDGSNIG